MKSKGIGQAMARLMELGSPGKSMDALLAAETAGNAPEAPPENEGTPKDIFEAVPRGGDRPDLSEQLGEGFFDLSTGLPYVAMTNFPMPRDEDEDATADADFLA
jgi:hypothetical protein